MRLSRILLKPGIFLAAALIALIAAFSSVGVIERVSEAAVEKAMLLDGQDWVHVEVDGLQVILSGTAPTEPDRFTALSVAASQVDSSRVIDRLEVPNAQNIEPPHFSIEILRNDAGISMIGLVPADFDRVALTERIAKITPADPPADLLETADYPVPDRWNDVVAYAVAALETLPRAKISVDTDRIAIEAIADSEEQKQGWERSLARKAPGGVRVALDISAPRPVITPFTARFVLDEDGPRFDACTAGTEEGRVKIVSAAIAAGAKGRPDCVIGLGMPTGDWPDAVGLGVAAVSALGHATITYSDADVTLVAGADVEQAVFDRVAGELEADLPDVFTLHASKIQAANDGEDGIAEFTATLSPEGQVQLRGRLSDEQERDIAESVARARFGIDNVYMAARLDPSLPRNWSVRVLSALEALSLLENGIAIVHPDLVELRGKTGDTGANAEISRLLSDKLGEAQDFRVNVVYDEALDPIAQLPKPEECVADISAAMAESKITFAPASVEIDASSGPTLDKIAAILRDCKDVPMEIGGHTDSQGGDDLNKALSQQRANSVLNALLARRVLTTNIIAYGYGEERPIADNETEEGRIANRRIEFRLLGAEEFERLINGNRVAVIAADGLSGKELEELSQKRPRPRPEDLDTTQTSAEDTEEPASEEGAETEPGQAEGDAADVAAEDGAQDTAGPDAETDGALAEDEPGTPPETAPDGTAPDGTGADGTVADGEPDAAPTEEGDIAGETAADETPDAAATEPSDDTTAAAEAPPPADETAPEADPAPEADSGEAQAPGESSADGAPVPDGSDEAPVDAADEPAGEDVLPESPAENPAESPVDEAVAPETAPEDGAATLDTDAAEGETATDDAIETTAQTDGDAAAQTADVQTGTEEPRPDPVVVHPELEGVRAPPRPEREE